MARLPAAVGGRCLTPKEKPGAWAECVEKEGPRLGVRPVGVPDVPAPGLQDWLRDRGDAPSCDSAAPCHSDQHKFRPAEEQPPGATAWCCPGGHALVVPVPGVPPYPPLPAAEPAPPPGLCPLCGTNTVFTSVKGTPARYQLCPFASIPWLHLGTASPRASSQDCGNSRPW